MTPRTTWTPHRTVRGPPRPLQRSPRTTALPTPSKLPSSRLVRTRAPNERSLSKGCRQEPPLVLNPFRPSHVERWAADARGDIPRRQDRRLRHGRLHHRGGGRVHRDVLGRTHL